MVVLAGKFSAGVAKSRVDYIFLDASQNLLNPWLSAALLYPGWALSSQQNSSLLNLAAAAAASTPLNAASMPTGGIPGPMQSIPSAMVPSQQPLIQPPTTASLVLDSLFPAAARYHPYFSHLGFEPARRFSEPATTSINGYSYGGVRRRSRDGERNSPSCYSRKFF